MHLLSSPVVHLWPRIKVGILITTCFGMGILWAKISTTDQSTTLRSLTPPSSLYFLDRNETTTSTTITLHLATTPQTDSKATAKPPNKAGTRTIETDLLRKAYGNCTASRSTLFRTTIPMYYINLDKDADKRAYMEKTYGTAGKLTRVKAVNGKNLTELYEYGVVDELTTNATDCCDKLTSQSPPTVVALTFSHFKAVKTAYDNGDEYAITFEDDASDMYVPYWQCTLEEVVQRANEEIPDWAMIRLMYTTNAANYNGFYTWFNAPKLFSHAKSPAIYGCVAQMYNRVGMKKLIDKYWDEAKQRWHCEHNCVADLLIPPQLGAAYGVQPPMFTYCLTEGYRGIRSKRGDSTGDNRLFHATSMLFGLQWNVEVQELVKMPGSQAVLGRDWKPK